jgi:diguanylate cyclase (GGDEF)-like protein
MVPQQSEQLLTYLKNTSILEGYSFAIFKSGEKTATDKTNRYLCGELGMPHICHEICVPSLNAAIENALASKKPQFFRCPRGLLSFTIPVSADSCLVCGGVRENLFDFYFCKSEQIEFMMGKQKVHPYEIMVKLERLPVATEKRVRETMLKTERLIKSFNSGERMQAIESDTRLQSTIKNVATAIRKTKSFDKALALFSEALGILFNIPSIVLVLKDTESNCCHLETCWGTFSGPSNLNLENLPFHDKKYLPTILTEDEVAALFTGGGMTSAICFPLFDNDNLFGMVVLFNVPLTAQVISLIEHLTGYLVGKLKEKLLINHEIRRKKRDVRLLEMIRNLALTESEEDLPRLIMEMAAELVDAANGHLMLIDKSGNMLRIAASIGVNPILAQSLRTIVDEGITGRMDACGTPLLIKDIEQEGQLGRQNQITKSSISLPFRFKEKIIGVINLADKINNAPFTSDDQKVLSTFIDQATVILVRAAFLRKAHQNSVTDPLTGLYNTSFLRKRLNEELSRSIRYNLPLTTIIASLDNLTTGKNHGNHPHADRLVKEFARILNASLRGTDLVGRFGEKEFCVILPSTPLKESVYVAKRINCSVKKELSYASDSPNQEFMTASVGIASFPENGSSSKDMINAARAALSRAEAEGGNKICFCSAT